MRVNIIFAWYDFWIGAFYKRSERKLYICLIPMVAIVIVFVRKYRAGFKLEREMTVYYKSAVIPKKQSDWTEYVLLDYNFALSSVLIKKVNESDFGVDLKLVPMSSIYKESFYVK